MHRTGWGRAYYVLHGRMIVQVEAEGINLAAGGPSLVALIAAVL